MLGPSFFSLGRDRGSFCDRLQSTSSEWLTKCVVVLVCGLLSEEDCDNSDDECMTQAMTASTARHATWQRHWPRPVTS